jgi:hypothetical protein
MGRHFLGLCTLADGRICASGGVNHSFKVLPTVEVLAVPSPVRWSPAVHATFPLPFQAAVRILMLCCVRRDVLVDDVVFLILSMLERHDLLVVNTATTLDPLGAGF